MEINDANSQVIKNSIKNILNIFETDREGIKETPQRVAKMYHELLTAEEPKITVFDANNYDQMIIDREIPFYSLCEHHIIPFFGTITIGYIPDKKIIGLSKLARISNYFSRRLNTQEYLTQNIANYIEEKINPIGVGVIIKARHLCKEMRGAKSKGEMITTCLKGAMLNDEKAREEFLMNK